MAPTIQQSENSPAKSVNRCVSSKFQPLIADQTLPIIYKVTRATQKLPSASATQVHVVTLGRCAESVADWFCVLRGTVWKGREGLGRGFWTEKKTCGEDGLVHMSGHGKDKRWSLMTVTGFEGSGLEWSHQSSERDRTAEKENGFNLSPE